MYSYLLSNKLPVFILLAILSNFNFTYAQSRAIGVGLAFSSTIAAVGNIHYVKDANRFHLGVTYQFNNSKGPAKSGGGNYGQSYNSSGDYFYTLDLGYSRVFIKKISVGVEGSLGSKNWYTNYNDSRFSSDAYHVIDKTDFLYGLGFNVGYIFKNNFELFTGFNTVSMFRVGLRYSKYW